MSERTLTIRLPERLYESILQWIRWGIFADVQSFIEWAVDNRLAAMEQLKIDDELPSDEEIDAYLRETLHEYETRYGISSEEFYARLMSGNAHDLDIVKADADLWAVICRSYLERHGSLDVEQVVPEPEREPTAV